MIDMVTTKQLGITLSNNSSWNSHIHEICSKTLRRLDILSCLRFKLSLRALKIMYFSFIRPILEYGNVLLTNCGLVNTDKMEKVQIQAARIVTEALQCTNTQRLYKETKWQTLKQRRDCHCPMSILQNSKWPDTILPKFCLVGKTDTWL